MATTNPLSTFIDGFKTGNQISQQNQAFDLRMRQEARQEETAAQEAEFAKFDRLGKYSTMLLKAPAQMRPGIYSRIRADVATDFPGEYPEQWSDDLLPEVQKIADALDPQPQQEQFTLSPGSARYGADGSLLVQQPFAPQKPEYVLSPDGTQWLPKPMGAPQQAPQGAPAAAGPMTGQAFYDEIGKLISPYGASVGSTNGGEHNPGSLHYDGRALDIPLGASATDAVRANADRMIADLSNKGYTVRDERTRPAGQKVWGGPHLHVEAPTQPQAPAYGGAIPIPGAQPRSKSSFTMLNPQEAAQYGLTPGTVAQRNDETGQVSVVSKPDARAGTGVMPLSAGEAAKVRRDFKETKDALSTFKAFDQALGDIPEGLNLVVDGAAKGRLGTSYNNARAALRILYNTGVLQPGELPMLESALRDPTSFSAIMDPRTRPQIQSQLDELYRTVTRGIENQVASYPQIFNQQKFDDFRQQKAGQQAGPNVGDVEDGYRYKGGNRADPNSWEKV